MIVMEVTHSMCACIDVPTSLTDSTSISLHGMCDGFMFALTCVLTFNRLTGVTAVMHTYFTVTIYVHATVQMCMILAFYCTQCKDRGQEDSTPLLNPVEQRVSYQACGKTDRPVDVQASTLPTSIDKIVPLSMLHLLQFVPKMATEWDKIGILMGLEDRVAELRPRNDLPSSNLTSLFQSWIRSGRNVSWKRLVTVLQDQAVNLGAVAAEITGYLCEQG